MPRSLNPRISRYIGILGLFALSSQPVWAASIWCTGTASDLYTSTGRAVTVRNSANPGYVQLCDLDTVWKGVPIEACKDWFALITIAVASGRQVTVYYSSTYTCATMPTYGSADAPSYVMLK